MTQKKGYDVLRFIEHGNGCYVSSVYVEGVILIQWLSERPVLKKQDLFLLLHEIAKQMDLLHRSKGMPVYQYMNPYCMVLTDDKKVLFVDMQAESSEERLRKMQSRKIRERFLPKEDPFYQNSSVQTDMYGYGKTLQFILSAVNLTEPLSRREEKKLQNLTSRCLNQHKKKQFQSALALRKQLPEMKETDERGEEYQSHPKRKWVLLAVFFLLAVAGILSTWRREELFPGTSDISGETSVVTYIEEVDGSEAPTVEEDVKDMTAEEGKDEIARIQEVLALEVLGRYEEAADLCEETLMGIDNIWEKEKLYEKSAALYLKTGNLNKALEVLSFGMEELVPSEYLWQCYLDILKNDDNVDQERKNDLIEEFLSKHPEYKEEGIINTP